MDECKHILIRRYIISSLEKNESYGRQSHSKELHGRSVNLSAPSPDARQF
jgi:hypothetical protein